jgi:L-asparagine transporter-like permease
MQLNQPKQITWWVAIVLLVLGLIGQLVDVNVLSDLSFWLALASSVLLLAATYFPGL